MVESVTRYALLAVAVFPFIYYLIAIYSAGRFFREGKHSVLNGSFTPPVSVLKPAHGIDPEPLENFSSFFQQNYPDYEIIFCVDEDPSPMLSVLEELRRRFPDRPFRVLYGSGLDVANDKVGKLARLVSEARHEVLVINDSDVRVEPNYLRTLVAPLANENTGAVTCFYVPTKQAGFVDGVQWMGMFSDFFAGILVARCLDGVKFALGTTIATTRKALAGFGGYEAIANRPADDMLVGRLIAGQGYKVELLPYAVETVPDYHSFASLFHKRLRWMVVMRHMRPWGHLGMLFTLGLPWVLVAAALHPPAAAICGYCGAYALLRAWMTWIIGVSGLKQKTLWKQFPLIAVWDALAFIMWLVSFTRNTIRWRDADYRIQNGELIPVNTAPHPVEDVSAVK